MSMKHSIDTIGNRTHNFPTCSKVAQPTVLPHATFSLLHCVLISVSDMYIKNILAVEGTVWDQDVELVGYHFHQPPLPPQGLFLVLMSVRGWVDPRATVRLEGLCQWNIPLTPSGIEPTTFQLVAKWLNQLRYHMPHFLCCILSLFHSVICISKIFWLWKGQFEVRV